MSTVLVWRVPVDSAIRTLAFTRDGLWVVTGHDDSTILVWDVAALLADVKEFGVPSVP